MNVEGINRANAYMRGREAGAVLGIGRRPVEPDENRAAAVAPLQPAIGPQDLATGGDVNLEGLNMQPRSALGGEVGVETPSQDAPGNSINPASEFARERKNRIAVLARINPGENQ